MSGNNNIVWNRRRGRVFTIIEIHKGNDWISRAYDLIGALAIVVNLTASILYTFDDIRTTHGGILSALEFITVLFFAVDYVLRLWTAKFLYPSVPERKAIRKYIFSVTGIIDLASFLPYYLPVLFPMGSVAFRMFRIVRIFRLFRINAYYDSLNVIAEVISSKRQQLFSSAFIILVLMVASSLCMYSFEHEAQPEAFKNAFSGIWWSVSALLTVGYGDIYPITPLGQALGIITEFLGVGMVAIPTGIISAGFVDQYSRIKRISEYANEENVRFIKINLTRSDSWSGRTIKELGLPHGVIVAVIQRGPEIIVPRGSVMLRPNDTLVLGAESFSNKKHIELKELLLKQQHPWNGQKVRDLDISRQTILVMVKRGSKVLIPNGDLTLLEGDKIVLYSQKRMEDASNIEV